MACVHLNQLYRLCQESQLRLSSSDLIHIVCKQCEKEEVCPSVLLEDEKQVAEPKADEPRKAEASP